MPSSLQRHWPQPDDMQVDVSIIVVHYNTPGLTEACVRSILQHTRGCSFEVLVVDNASSIGDMAHLEALDARVRVLRQQHNLGFAGGNNAGWAKAQGRYVLLLNSDTELVEDAISFALQRLEADSTVGVLSVKLVYADGRPQHVTGAFPRLSTELLALTRLEKLLSPSARTCRYYNDLADPDQPARPDWVWGAFWMAPRAVIERMPGGKLPDDFFMYYEDVLWAWVVRTQQKLAVAYEPGAKVIHHLSGSATDIANEEAKYRQKTFPNEYAFLRKHKGQWYAKAFYGVRILHLLSLRTAPNRAKAIWYWQQVFKAQP